MRRLYYYLIGLIALLVSLIFDNQISIFFTSYRIEVFNTISLLINSVSSYAIFGFVFLILFLKRQYKKFIPLILVFIMYLGLTSLIKIVIARPRPFVELNNSLVENLNPYKSFPSGHAAAVFSLITFFGFDKRIYYIWIFIAVIISLSRVYLGVHYLSDVIAGALLGCFIGELAPYLLKCYNQKVYK